MKNALLSLLLACPLFLSSKGSAAIFGIDNRTIITAGSPQNLLARSTAIAVLSANHSTAGPGKVKLEVDSLSDLLCRDEKFAQDPSLSYSCSGFLVGPDLIATAGHCMVNTGEDRHETDTYCQAYAWLFDFQTSTSGKTNTDSVPAENLYKCKEVVYAIREEVAPFRDFALVRLDRPALGRMPLKLSSHPVAMFDDVSMIGYPLGSPMKFSPLSKVLFNDLGRQSFVTNLDAFEGNSGSAVFNRSGEVSGILIGGTPTQGLIEDTEHHCQRYNRCSEDGTSCQVLDKNTSVFPGFQGYGSEVQRISPLLELLKSL
jgi:V8-like Glu-specific endopeptidase